MSVFCFLRKAIQTSRVAHFAKHLTFQFMRKRLLSRAVHQRGDKGRTERAEETSEAANYSFFRGAAPIPSNW